jgi:transposase
MLKTPQRQGSFYDVEYICDELIPEDSFYRKFRQIVWPLIKNKDFESMYCQDNGRPPIRPSLLAMAMILQFHKNLSDREMERACMYDIELKYALGLRLDERPFDHSSLGDFRKRLLENNKEKAIFDQILNHLMKTKLIERDEIQRIDATHIIADVAIPTMVTLVKKGVYEVLKPLKGRYKDIYQKITKEINISEYSRETINQDAPGRLDTEKKKSKLVEVVNDARKVLKSVEAIKANKPLRKRVDLLKRILQENIEENDKGKPKEIRYKDKPKDILVTPIDEDARYGAKSDKKRFVGYKANVTESVKNRLITNIKAMRGNCRDGDTAVEAIIEQHRNGLKPEKIIGDTAYSDGEYRKELKRNETPMIAPLRKKNTRSTAVYPKSMFHYDKEKQTLTCPQGVLAKPHYYDSQQDTTTFHFPMKLCRRCPSRAKCTNAKEGRRTVGISGVQEVLFEAEEYNQTEAFQEDMKLRPIIEGKLSELKRYHGLRRARYRGLQKVNLQCYFAATAVNIKRWINILMDKIKPDKELQLVF